MTIPQQASGFSAVELLITLFVGFLFVTMGYQLYSVVVQSGGDSREQVKAGNLAYERLRTLETTTTVTLPCSGGNTVDNNADDGKAVMTTTMSCPITNQPNIHLVKVSVKYNVSQKEVSHALYIVR